MRIPAHLLILAVLLAPLACVLAFDDPPAARQMVELDDLSRLRAGALPAWARIANHPQHLARLPLSRASAAPAIDGKLDDPCWQGATSVCDLVRYAGFEWNEPARRCRFCADEANLYLALDLSTRRSRDPSSTIEIRAVGKGMRIEFTQDKIRWNLPGAKEPSPWVTGCKFLGNGSDGVLEAAIPMATICGGTDWKKDGVRLLFRYGPLGGSDVAQGRWIHLYDADTALALDEPKPSAQGEDAFRVTLIGSPAKSARIQAEVCLIRESTLDKPQPLATATIELGKGERKTAEVRYRLPFCEGACAVELVLRGEGWDCRLASQALALPISPLPPKIQEMLQAYGTGRGEKLNQWQGEAAAIAKSLEEIKLRRADLPPDLEAWRGIYRRARRLQRDILLSQLPPQIDQILFVKRYPYTAGGRWFTTHYHFEPGGHNLCVYSVRTGALRPLLNVPDHTALRDPALSYDGKQILFVARSSKPEIFGGFTDDLHDVWSIYQINTDGTGLKRLTKSPAYDLEPVWLPDGEILFASLRSKCWGCCTGHSVHNFHIMNGDGSNIRRFTGNYLYDIAASVMPDGRIIFLRWVHEDKPGNHINALWTVRQDGTGLAGFFGMNVYGCFIEPRAIPGTGQVVCIDSGPSGHWRLPQNGHIGIIDPAVDRNNLVRRVETPLPFGDGWGFKTPYPLTQDLFLASFGNLQAGFGIYLVDIHGNMELLYRDPKLSCYNAVPLAPTEPPPVTPPTTAGGPDDPAVVTVLDVYSALPGVARGTVKALRVVQVPDKDIVTNGNSAWADQTIAVSYVYRMVRKVLGTTPVCDDGSACFRVPGGKAVYFQLLDKDGMMVQTMRDTTSFKPGERISCVGCHEPRQVTPPISMRAPLALRQPIADLQPLPGGVRGVSFPRDIQPILDRACVPCHDITKPDGNVILSGDLTQTFNLAYEALNAHNRDWGHSMHPKATDALAPVITYVANPILPHSSGAYASPLFQKYVLKDHYGVKLTKDEIATLALWVDLNLPYYDDWDSKRYAEGRNILLSREARTVLTGVYARRCAECHDKGRPLAFEVGYMVNLTRPELSKVLQFPLAVEGGGKGQGKMSVFKSVNDPDYQAILQALRAERKRIPSLVEAGSKQKAG